MPKKTTRTEKNGAMDTKIEGERARDAAPLAWQPAAPPTFRSFYVKESEVAMHRCTEGCKGCNAIRMESHNKATPVEARRTQPQTCERVGLAEESGGVTVARCMEQHNEWRMQDAAGRPGKCKNRGNPPRLTLPRTTLRALRREELRQQVVSPILPTPKGSHHQVRAM